MRPISLLTVLVLAGGAVLAAVGCSEQQPGPADQPPAVRADHPAVGRTEGPPKADSQRAESMGAASTTDAKATVTQRTCPVMGEPIDPTVYTDYQGRRIYFCCQACIAKFNKDPQKYLSRLQ